MSTILIPGKATPQYAIGQCPECTAVFKKNVGAIYKGEATGTLAGTSVCASHTCYGMVYMYHLDSEKGVELLEMVKKYQEENNNG